MLVCALIVMLEGAESAARKHNTPLEASAYASVADGEEASYSDWTIHVSSAHPNYMLGKSEPATGVYLGAYVLQNSTIHYSMAEFNQLAGKQHASFFKYVGYGEPFPVEWVNEVKAEGAFPHIAWEPNNGLAEVKDNAYLRGFADAARKADVPIFLRFASEMNGTWTNYSGDPELYMDTWRLVHDIFEERAPKTAMVWTVLNVPERPIEDYYPGDDYVDWIGINVYNVRYHNGDLKQRSDFEDPLQMIDYVYNRFSRTKPIQLSEYGVTHYTVTDGVQDNEFAISKINRLYANLQELYPRVKAVYYFDVNNLTEYNEARRINDYSITGEQQILEAYQAATASPYYLSRAAATAGSGTSSMVTQPFTYRGHIFEQDGELYVDEQFFSHMLQVEIETTENGMVRLTRWENGAIPRAAQVPFLPHKIWSGYKVNGVYPLWREINALPLVMVAEELGYQISWNGKHIYIEE
ncbi:glycoside hydrolase family 26 protein [Paenibacillus glycanilyticus]|uniref:glycoside hydrolase family 26 protein n=1 Tax=Paenibacillus glycanilyticus TaxID=126569 RepID=UPI00203BEA62|nr:glycosyl hydrolase [Paenibacillus glycanilyticus]MCM3630929.1 glycoside hydrolase family 26 protein [Paenibacillus glycanilyticus]